MTTPVAAVEQCHQQLRALRRSVLAVLKLLPAHTRAGGAVWCKVGRCLQPSSAVRAPQHERRRPVGSSVAVGILAQRVVSALIGCVVHIVVVGALESCSVEDRVEGRERLPDQPDLGQTARRAAH